MYTIKPKNILPYLLMIPALFIGTSTMISRGVTSSIWIQNILAWIITSIAGSLVIANGSKRNSGKEPLDFYSIFSLFAIPLLMIPFLFNGIDGVHRWAAIGPIRFYIASIFLPLLIICLWNLLFRQRIVFVLAIAMIALILLLFHPDASQATAFAGATVVLLWTKVTNKLAKILYCAFSAVVCILVWVFLDSLSPVPYVEQILFWVAARGSIWLIAGVVSLLLLLLPFFLFNKNTLSVSLGIYFLLTILATFLGNFPVPIMGYGISPILGYSIAVTLLTKYQKTIRV